MRGIAERQARHLDGINLVLKVKEGATQPVLNGVFFQLFGTLQFNLNCMLIYVIKDRK